MVEEVPKPQRAARRVPPPRLIAAAVITALVLVFAFQNSRRVKIDYIVIERESRLIFIILGSAVLGAIAGALVRRARRRRERG
jgi:uncharacterized integral membrane protein